MKFIEVPVKQKRKRFNKNKKKAWRKKIDITDVEEKLEDKLREERFGGALEEKPSEDLFSLDLGTSDNKVRKVRKVSVAEPIFKKPSGLKPSIKRVESRPLKSHEYLNGLPGVEAISKKGAVRKQKEMKSIKFARKLSKNTPKMKILRKAYLKQKRNDAKKNRKTKFTADFNKDLWASNKEDEKLAQRFGETGETFMKDALLYYKAQTRQAIIKVPKVRFEKPSLLPAVVPPKAGASYNPSFEDHQKLLGIALKFQKKKEFKKQKEKRQIEKYVPSSKDGVTEAQQMKEMVEGLPLPFNHQQSVDEKDKDGKVEEEEEVTCVGRGKSQKKNKQARNRAKTLKIEERRRVVKKMRKRMESEVDKIRIFNKEITESEKSRKILQEKKIKKAEQAKYKPKRISKFKFKEEDVVVPLGDELTGCLRTIKTKRDLLQSAIKNFQRRNMLESRSHIKKVQPKKRVKRIPRRGQKDDMKAFMKSLKDMI